MREKGKRLSKSFKIINSGNVRMHLRVECRRFRYKAMKRISTLNDDTHEEQDMLSASFGPSPRQWPRIRVHPKAVMLDAGTESHITVHVLFHPDKEDSDVNESAIDILATEGSWQSSVLWKMA